MGTATNMSSKDQLQFSGHGEVCGREAAPYLRDTTSVGTIQIESAASHHLALK
jgi:hypothetical protein